MCFVSENSSIFPSDLIGKPILYHLVSKVCVCETHLKDGVLPSVFVLFFREQLNCSQCLVGNHNWTNRYLKCVCVCARHILKDGTTHNVLVFQRTVYCPLAFCAIFSREQFLFQHITKKKRDILVYRTNTVCLFKSPPHGLRLFRRTDKSRYCVFTK